MKWLSSNIHTEFLRMFVLAFGLLFLFPITANAAYSVQPLIIEAELEPRDTYEETIVVTNNGQTPITVFGSVNNVTLGAGGGLEEFITPVADDRSASLSSWLEFDRGRLLIQPGDSVEVPLTIRVNLNAEPGTHHALISFASGKNSTIAAANAKQGNAPGLIVTVRVADNTNEFLRLSQFVIDRIITNPNEQNVQYSVRNPGNTELVPEGDIIFYNNRGIEVAQMPVNPDGQSIAPGEEMQFSAVAPTEGMLGKYKALLTVEYGSSQLAAVNDTTFFYVAPWQKLLIIFLILLAFVLGIAFFVHFRSRRYESLHIDDDEADELPVLVRKEQKGKAYDHDVNLKQ